VHDKEGGTTYCSGCREPLIVRDWHQIANYKVTDFGHCLTCGTSVAGRYEAFTGQFGRRRIPVRINAYR
jgi:pyruvate formate lyase activating enzyme